MTGDVEQGKGKTMGIQLGFHVEMRGASRRWFKVHTDKFNAAFNTFKDALRAGHDAAMWSYHGNGRWHRHYASEHYPSEIRRPMAPT